MPQAFLFLPAGQRVDLLPDKAGFVAVAAPQDRLLAPQFGHAPFEIARRLETPPLPLDTAPAQLGDAAVVLDLALVEGILLLLQRGDALRNAADLGVDALPHAARMPLGKRRCVAARDDGHIERRALRSRKHVAFGRDIRIDAVGPQPQQGLALRDRDTQGARIVDVGDRTAHKAVAGDQPFERRQIDSINSRADRGRAAAFDPFAHPGRRHQTAARRAVGHLDFEPFDQPARPGAARRKGGEKQITADEHPQKGQQRVSERTGHGSFGISSA